MLGLAVFCPIPKNGYPRFDMYSPLKLHLTSKKLGLERHWPWPQTYTWLLHASILNYSSVQILLQIKYVKYFQHITKYAQ